MRLKQSRKNPQCSRVSKWSLCLLISFLIMALPTCASVAEIDMGTTIVAFRFDKGVVVGADTRTSVSGYVSNRFAHKISTLWEKCVVCRSGSAADTQYLVDEARWNLMHKRNRLLGASASTVSQAAYWLKDAVKTKGLSSTSLICAGYDDVLKRGVIYSVSPSGSLVEEPSFCVSGSGSSYILGHLDHQASLFETMTEQQAVRTMIQSIRLAMDRDGSSGGFVRVLVLTNDGQRIVTAYPGEEIGETDQDATTQQEPLSSKVLPGFASPVSNTKR